MPFAMSQRGNIRKVEQTNSINGTSLIPVDLMVTLDRQIHVGKHWETGFSFGSCENSSI